MATYKLTVDGLVNNPLTLTYDEILQFPSVTEVVTLVCPGYFADNPEWTGVPLKDILSKASIKPGASKVTIFAIDGYPSNLSLEKAQQDGVFLAYKVDGQILPEDHGYPLRLVAEGEVGSKWTKWVAHIEVK